MGRYVLINSDVLMEVAEAFPDTLGVSHFNLRMKVLQPIESKYEPLAQIAEELRKHGLTLIRSSKGFRVERLGEVKAQKITGLCMHKKTPGGCQLHNLQCGYPSCDEM